MKAMTYVLGCLIFLGFSQHTFAQRGEFLKERRAELEAEKQEFVNQRANFSETEARSYWQLKAAYEQQRRDLLQAERKQRKARAKTEDLSDEEARTLILAKMAHQRSLLDLQEAHLMRAMDQMGAAAVLRGLAAEKAWKRELLRRLRDKRSLEEEEQELDF